ncbi:sterol desaturase family protein [Algivirga pacifica]|uniref:Fatty acid hydroxylase domain-containing protein n=1 Tax=Algivirga pacifica TaxID=1162670 RepID=A0ABP9D840_9BACT
MTHTNDYIPPKNKGRKQLFESGFLEMLTKTHIAMPLTFFPVTGLSVMAYGLYQGYLSLGLAIGLFLVGVLSFSLVEYLVHRFVFHMEPDTKLKQTITYKFHGVHHEYPKDKMRLAMPMVVSIFLTVVMFTVFWFLMGRYAFGFMPGFVVGYAAYLGVHYIVHAYRPPKNMFKTLWVHHGIHHYKHNDRAFGVSSPLWDYIFRTMP